MIGAYGNYSSRMAEYPEFLNRSRLYHGSSSAASQASDVDDWSSIWRPPLTYKARRRRAAAFRDFVLVTEFSEIEGPVPLLTIPRDTKLDSRRLNDLSVRLMSTDYQSRGGSHSSVAPDVQVFQTNLLPGVHAFANYVTLCDVRARGFVRPLCVAYVTGDELKVPVIFEELRERILRACDMFKHTNRLWFETELSALLADFTYTKEEYLKWSSAPESSEALNKMIAEDTLHVFGVLSNRDNPALRSWHDAGNIPMETEEVDDEVPNLSEIACLDEPLRHEEVKESSASGSDIVDKSDEPLLERRNLVEVISNVEIENDVLSAVSAGSLQSSPVFVEFHEASKLSLPEEALGKLPTKQLHYSSSSPNLNFPSDDCSLKSETLEIKKVTLAEFADVPKSDEEALFIKGIPDLKTEIDELKVEMEEPQRSSPVLDCLEEGNCVPEEASKTRQVMDSVRSSSPGSNPMPDGSLLESESLHIKDMTSSGSDVNKTLSGNGGIPSVELDIYELSADSADARKSSLSQGAFDLPPVKDLVRSSSFTISNSTSDGCALKKFSSDEHLPAAKKFDFGNDGEILERVNLQSLACQISECELMLRSLEPSINDADARARVDRWKRAVYDGKFRCTRLLLQLFLGKDLESKKRSPRLIAPTPLKRTFDSIRPFHVLCQWGILPGIEILYDVAERYSIPTQCSKFHKLDSFFRTHVMSEFCLNLDIGMLKCLSTVPSVSDGKLDIDVFDPECVAFIEAWATSLQCRQVSKFNRRTLTHDIFASEGFFHLAPDPRWEMLQSDQDSEVFAEIDKYYVDSGPSSVSSEPPPVSQILCREEKLDNIVAEHVSRAMENLNLGDAGWNLGTFFHLFAGVAYHILYSLLSGRPVVIAGIESSESNVVERVRALEAFLPRGSRVLRWHTGIVDSFHVQRYNLIGICVPERLSVMDMMSSANLNRVTVLNTENQHIFGPAYSGSLLENLTHTRAKRAFQSDKAVLSQAYGVLVSVSRKVFLCYALTKEGRLQLKEVMAALGLDSCDRQIVKYLLDKSSCV
ncbi:unnamed protein product [Notodromas monacha]|uniref:UDENN FLCN/SMCR8-type domain-containing protein n=1 Tax=Notodromas monacha TaxID=399045 RepID=A0A7R9BRD7_9CRUS|nr:unnamed protein product [Notodromas monacha]CAG0920298.1 unnamed protein product [Notodromas monacha]